MRGKLVRGLSAVHVRGGTGGTGGDASGAGVRKEVVELMALGIVVAGGFAEWGRDGVWGFGGSGCRVL